MRLPTLLILALVSFGVDALDFKGLDIGGKTTPSKVEEALGGGIGSVRCGLGASEMQVCNGATTIANTPATVNAVLSKDGELVRVMLTFDSSAFDLVTGQMKAKYGSPRTEGSEQVQNGYGATFTQTRGMWDDESGNRIDTARFAGKSTTRSFVAFSSPADPIRARPSKDQKPDM